MTEIELLKEIRDHLFSLRMDLAPVTHYFATLTSNQKNGLPVDFPGRDLLEAAGITAVSQIPRTIRKIEAITGDTNTAMMIARELSKK